MQVYHSSWSLESPPRSRTQARSLREWHLRSEKMQEADEGSSDLFPSPPCRAPQSGAQ